MSAILEQSGSHFRPMTEADLAVVMDIEQHAYQFPWTPGIFRDCLRVGYCCWVLEHDGNIQAYGVMSIAAGEAHILNLCVRTEMQRQGFGRKVLLRLIDIARRHGADTILLEVRPSNGPAISLYQHEGFHEVGERRHYYPAEKGRENALILARNLD